MIQTGSNFSRVALYARFSSHQQNAKSVDDRMAECRRYIADLGGTVVAEYTDSALSGSTASARRCGRGR